MARFCLFCGAALQPASGSVVRCSACGKSFHDPATAGAPAAKGGIPTVAWVLILVLGAGPVVVAVIGILAAIAIPNVIRFKSRSKQVECQATLRAIATAQQAHRAEHRAFATTFSALGVSAPPDNRYAYVLGAQADQRLEVSAKHAAAARQASGVELTQASATSEAFTALCVGNIDNDVAPDVWAVSSDATTDSNGDSVAAGTPFVVVDDLTTYD
jgi:type IV pilus assembly protein PilA